MSECYENCPRVSFKKGDKVRTTEGYSKLSCGNCFTGGRVVNVKKRGDSRDLVKVCVDGKIDELDEAWLEHDDCDPCPSLVKRIFCKPPCCGRRCC